MSRSRTIAARSLAALAAGAALVAPALPASAADPATSSSSLTPAQMLVVHQATQGLRTPAMAVAAGYLPTDDCAELPGVGGMGYHYVNPVLAGDDVIDPALPEILVFIPAGHGQRRLGAVEYFKADADQDVTTTADRPSLFGTHPFDGPMLGHEPGMPIHYDLHVWLYKHNPDGQLAAWNPAVSC